MNKITPLIYRTNIKDFLILNYKSSGTFYEISREFDCNSFKPEGFQNLENCYVFNNCFNKVLIFDKMEYCKNNFLNMRFNYPYELSLLVSEFLVEKPILLKYCYHDNTNKIHKIELKENFNICINKNRINEKIISELKNINEIKIEEKEDCYKIETNFDYFPVFRLY